MAEKKSWSELFKHPNWQKKRLEILNRANFECEDCGSNDKTLHVHHSYYEKGLAPWEYPEESLYCLCEDCHKRAQDINALIQKQIGKLELGNHEILLGYTLGLEAMDYPMVILDVFSYEVAQGVGDCWGLSPEQITDALEEGKIDGWTLDKLRKSRRKDE